MTSSIKKLPLRVIHYHVSNAERSLLVTKTLLDLIPYQAMIQTGQTRARTCKTLC